MTADNRLPINELDGVYKAYFVRAVATAKTIITNLHAYPGQAVHLGADQGSDLWQHFTPTAAWAAAADRQ